MNIEENKEDIAIYQTISECKELVSKLNNFYQGKKSKLSF